MLTNQYGYILLRREPDGPVEVWRESDDALCHTATEFLYAFQWAYSNPHVASLSDLQKSRRLTSSRR